MACMVRVANIGNDDDEVIDRRDLAGQGFLRLFCQLRITLLQDSVIMKQEFPSHPTWTDPNFARDGYAAFAKESRNFVT
jgi:hypothetical protein